MLKVEDRGFRAAGHIVLTLFSVICVIPFILLVSASLTDSNALLKLGYTIIPSKFSLNAYSYIFQHASDIFRSFGISVLITFVGIVLSVTITALVAYPLSRKDLPLKKIFSFLVILTLLFNGGLVPTYLVYTQLLHIKNTLFALLIPSLLTNGFIIILARTYFITSIPVDVLESSMIDGASEFTIFRKIVLPMSLPILATIGLMQGLNYWNDWNNGLLYLTNSKLFSMQNLLNKIMTDIQFLATSTFAGQIQTGAQLPTESIRMAIASIAVIPILCAYPFFQKYFVKGITLGAVKG